MKKSIFTKILLAFILFFFLASCVNHYQAGKDAMQKEDYRLAMEEFQKIESEDTTYKESRLMLAKASSLYFLQIGKEALANGEFQKALEMLGKIPIGDENFAEAIKSIAIAKKNLLIEKAKNLFK